MRTLRLYLLRSFLPSLLVALLFFTLIIELADLFANLVRYLQTQADIATIARVQFLYLPKCLSFSIPIAMIFSTALTMGNLYANNELIAVFSAGVSLLRFTSTIIAFGALVSVASFFLQEGLVINSVKAKNELSRQLLGFAPNDTANNIVLFDKGTRAVYRASLYNAANRTLSDVLVVKRKSDGSVELVLRAASAAWDDASKRWIFNDANLYAVGERDVGGNAAPELAMSAKPSYGDAFFDLRPDTFQQLSQNIDELKVWEAGPWIQALKQAGLPSVEAEERYWERFSFACTPLIVSLLSCAIGSRFRKNILLMSLLVSLMLAVIYYVLQMVAGLLANFQILPPAVGAWTGAAVFAVVAWRLYLYARN